MFCPKCGMKNPETGKFCRSCGTDLSPVSEALTGNASKSKNLVSRKGKPINWESAFGKIFMGIAFMVVSVILGFTGMGKGWWFWMLIPAFGMFGSGMAHYIQLKKAEQQGVTFLPAETQNVISAPEQNSALPPAHTEYVAPDSQYKTGDLVPPSVTDNTTRHLEVNSEGETMTLPKPK